MVLDLPSGVRPRVRILPSHKVLVQDIKSQWILSKGDDQEIRYEIAQENVMRGQIGIDICPKDFFGDDCTFSIEQEEPVRDGSPWKLTFNGKDGHIVADAPTRLNNQPGGFILQKVAL